MVRRLIDRFYRRLRNLVAPLSARSLLDAGCGEGETLARLADLLPPRVAALDLSPAAVEFTAARFPAVDASAGSLYELPYEDAAFELVLCLEVLEHLDRADAGLDELARVSGGHVIVSVPHEPWFRVGSLARGKHLRALGDHPEHVNHWNAASLGAQLEPRLEVLSLSGSFPWLIACCRPR